MRRTKPEVKIQATPEPRMAEAYALGRQHGREEATGPLQEAYMRGWFEAQQKLTPAIKTIAYEAGRLQGLQDAFNTALEAANGIADPEHAATGRAVAHSIRRSAGK